MSDPGSLPRGEPPPRGNTLDDLMNLVDRQAAPPPAESGSQEVRRLLTPPQGPDELGRLGKYRVLRLLGEGGMGAVFLAEDVQLRRCVALKLMKPQAAASAQAGERFLREARAMAALKSDHLVTIYEVGEQQGAVFLAMEFLDGLPLDRRLHDGPRPSLDEAVRIGREVALGLATAHDHGLIHRDVKPGNVWLEAPAGRIKLLDFGLARAADDPHLTQSGTIVGTPAYMSPEQAQGLPADARSDLFSVGVLLYKLTTNHLPFAGETSLALLAALVTSEPRPIRQLRADLPPDLARLIMQLLARSPEDRPPSARAVAEQLQRVEGALAAPARPATAQEQVTEALPQPIRPDSGSGPAAGSVPRARGGRRWLLGVAALVLLVGGAGVLAPVLLNGKRPSEPGSRPEPPPGNEGAAILDKPSVRPALPRGAVPLDGLQRADIPADELAAAGDGDPAKAAAELVAVLGDSRLQHWSPVGSVSFSPDGKYLASGGGDGVRLWDAATFQQLRRFGGTVAENAGEIAVFSPDSKWLTCAFGPSVCDGIRVHEVETGKRVVMPGKHSKGIAAAAFSPDSKILVTLGGGQVKAWDVLLAKERYSRPNQPPNDRAKEFITHMFVVADGPQLVTVSQGGILNFLDLATGEEQRSVDLKRSPSKCALSRDGKTLVILDKGLFLRDTATGAERPILEGKGIYISFMALTPDGRRLILDHTPSHLSCWNIADGKMVWQQQRNEGIGRMRGLAFSPNGEVLASAHIHGAVLLWDAATGKERPVRSRPGHTGALYGLGVTPDGKTLVSGGRDGQLRQWDLAVSPPRALRVLGDPALVMTSMALAPDAGTVIGSYGNAPVRRWDLASGAVRILDQLQLPVAAWPAGGNVLAGITQKSELVLFDADGTEQKRWQSENHKPAGLALSPDGRWLATTAGTIPRSLRQWDVATGKAAVETPGLGIVMLRFSPDSKRLAATNYLGVALFEVGNAEPRLWVDPASVWSVAFSPEGRTLLSAAADGRVSCRRIEDGERERAIQVGPAGVSSNWRAVYSPDGRHVLTANPNGTIYVLRLAPAAEQH